MLAYYSLLKNGQIILQDSAVFKLHDTLAEFESAPRVFTTALVNRIDSRRFDIPAFDRHLLRLERDARRFDLFVANPPAVTKLIHQALKDAARDNRNSRGDLRLRLISASDRLSVTVEDVQRRWPVGHPASLLSFRGERPFSEQKTTATEICLAAQQSADAASCEEALLIDFEGIITETSWSSFFWVDSKDTLQTAGSKVLPGIGREIVLDLFPCRFDPLPLAMLHERAKECFLSQSVHGITPVVQIDGQPIGKGVTGPKTEEVWAAFSEALLRESVSLEAE